jgi:hypothetical protein
MRTVGQFAFSTLRESSERCSADYQTVLEAITAWIGNKGTVESEGGILRYRDGRDAAFESQAVVCGPGRAASWKLSEPTAGGRFMTEVSVACSGEELAFNCLLSAGAPESVLAPVSVEARCPQVVRSVVDLNLGWRVGETLVRTSPVSARTTADGAILVEMLRRPGRALPVVAVSEHFGLVLHPQISDALARDLTGIAIVGQLSDEASWELTRSLGREWSCFNGAIRLFWPFGNERGDPHRHPLWTSQRLLEDVANTEEAATRIRTILRRRLYGLSAFAVEPSRLFETIRRAALDDELIQRRRLAQDHHDSQELLDLLAQEEQTLRRELENERDINRQLRQDLYNLQARLVWRDGGGDLEPSIESSPRTVEEAVDRARRGFPQFLTFGDRVQESIRAIAPEAGPPDKIYDYLQALADLARLRRDGPIGAGMVQWLAQRGIAASGESETVRNSPSEMAKRRWHDGRQHREFELHLKPAEATAPDRCVRIYFDWDDITQKVVVGWVGRHP